MKLTATSINDVREVFKEMRVRSGTPYVADESGYSMSMPERLGSGFIRNTRLRDGFEVFVMDCAMKEDFEVEVSASEAAFEVSVNVVGRTRFRISGVDGDFVARPGRSGVFCVPPEVRWVNESLGGERVGIVEIRASAEFLEGFLEGSGGYPEFIEDFLDGSLTRPSISLERTKAEESVALGQLLSFPYDGPARRMFLESKALEILALRLSEPSENGTSKLRPDDVERVRIAADILAERIEDPPSLVDLARLCGLNDFKLKVGFREVFGTTAFGYLRELRLQKARHLLEEGEMSVGEISAAVGYAGQSHFSAAFKKRFGIKPISLLRKNPVTISLPASRHLS